MLRDNDDLKKQEQDLIKNAKIKARDILLDAKEDANEIIKKLNNNDVDIKKANNIRNNLNDKIKSIAEIVSEKFDFDDNDKLELSEIKPNAEVFVKSLGKNGTIISHISKDKEVQVQIGILKMNVKIDDLKKVMPEKNKSIKDSSQNYTKISKTQNVKTEINVIGMNVDEAVYLIDKYMDNCMLAKLNEVRIIHGKGTGKLREGIHKYLKTNSNVKSFRIGTYGEGEMGVTVVEMNN